MIPRKIQFKGGSSLNIYFHEASFSHTFQNSSSKIGHLSRKGTFYSKKSLHKSCWKCNFEDFLFYDFFSWDTSFSHKWQLNITDQFGAFFKMVPQKLVICGKRRHFRAKGSFTKVVGNAILKNFYFMTFFLGHIL